MDITKDPIFKSIMFALFVSYVAFVSQSVFAGETITAQEVEGYFYADGEMKRSKGQFENTYYIDGDAITRTRVYDRNRKEVIPDNTVYQIQRQLSSDPSSGRELEPVVIRAIGQPGADAVEILMVGETFIQAVKSTSDYFVISRMRRIE
jgi:hypothetical protein